jgi:hypothetical protein
MIRPPLTRREYEILQLALRRAAAFENECGNTIAAHLLVALSADVERSERRDAA